MVKGRKKTKRHDNNGRQSRQLIVCPHRSKTLDGEERSMSRNAANVLAANVSVLFDAFRLTSNVPDPMKRPSTILGAAWGVQSARMSAGIYFPLFLVLIDKQRRFAIYYLPADLQHRNYFITRRPLSKNARRAGWRGITYDLRAVPKGAIVLSTPARDRPKRAGPELYICARADHTSSCEK